MREAEQFAEDERHRKAQHDAGGQKQHQDAEQVADQPDRADHQRRDRPYRILARDAGQVPDCAAELAEPFHRQLAWNMGMRMMPGVDSMSASIAETSSILSLGQSRETLTPP